MERLIFFHKGEPYVAIVKDGVGIGRTMLLKNNFSVIGTSKLANTLFFTFFVYSYKILAFGAKCQDNPLTCRA